MDRLGQIETVAATAIFLKSDKSGFTAGAEVRVDGGMSQV